MSLDRPIARPISAALARPMTGRAEEEGSLLDQYPGAAAAYSLRKLRAGYSGPCVRVRRSSDNAEQDFTASQITDGTLVSFCGTGDGLVTTWYDQSGNSNDATQTTASEQPRIVTAGVLVTENGRPALGFDGVDDFLQAPILTSYWNNAHASIMVFNFISASGFMAGGFNASTTDRERYRPNTYNRMSMNPSIISSGQSLASYLYNGVNNGGLMEPFVNSVLQNTANQTTEFSDLQLFDLGASVDFENYANCIIQEVILYATDQSANREAIEQNIASHYGITLA